MVSEIYQAAMMTKIDGKKAHYQRNNSHAPQKDGQRGHPPIKPKRIIHPHAGGGDAASILNPADIAKEIDKVFNEEIRKFNEDHVSDVPESFETKLIKNKKASDKLDADIRACAAAMFPKAFTFNEDDSSADVDFLSMSVTTEILSVDDTVDSSAGEVEEESFASIPFGTLQTHEDAERCLNVHIASWFNRHFDHGCAFENIMRDYGKLKLAKNSTVEVPYLSYENETTTKEAYKIRASRINPEDYRGMRFVICDNPDPSTNEDFWRLVWKERARAIVNMRFEPLEADKPCYWPSRQNPVMQFGDFVVKFRGVRYKTSFVNTTSPNADTHVYRTTSLSVYNTKKLRIRPANIEYEIDRLLYQKADKNVDDEYLEFFECHSIKHICFERWPDLLLPIPWCYVNSHSEMAIVLSEHVLKQELRNHQRFRGPVIVHSPVGSSRPVCLIALKHSLARLYFDRVIDISSSIMNVYKQRNHCVISASQYMMLTLLVMEEALRRGMVDEVYRGKVDRLWDELIYYVGRRYGYALSTFYRNKQALDEN